MTTLDKSKSKEEIKTLHLWVIFFIAGLAILAVLLFYHHYFGSISSDNNTWGTFGDYIGGTLNPILSFLALIALLYTIHIQTRELRLSRDELELTKVELAKSASAVQKQAAHFEREERRTDIYRLIEILENRINNNINSNLLHGNISLHEIIYQKNNLSRGGLTMGDGIVKLKEWHDRNDPLTINLLRWLESDLSRLKNYIGKYEKTSAKGIKLKNYEDILENIPYTTPLPEFYIAEFGYVVHILYTYHMLPEDLHDYYCEAYKVSDISDLDLDGQDGD